MAAIGFLDLPVEDFFDPLRYGFLNTSQGRGGPVFVQTDVMKFHGLALLSRHRSVLFD